MVQLARSIGDTSQGIRLKHIITSDGNKEAEGLVDQLELNQHQLGLELDRGYLPLDLGFEPVEDTKISPSIERCEGESGSPTDETYTDTIDLKIRSEDGSP
jgi:hypothetical protein